MQSVRQVSRSRRGGGVSRGFHTSAVAGDGASSLSIRTDGSDVRIRSRRPYGGHRTPSHADRGSHASHRRARLRRATGGLLHCRGAASSRPRGSSRRTPPRVVNDVGLGPQQGEIVGLLAQTGGETTPSYDVGSSASGRKILLAEGISNMPMYKRARQGMATCRRNPDFRKLSVEDNIMAILETLPLSKARDPEA